MIDSSAPPQLALMIANTFDEFCANTPYKELLKCRYHEAKIPADTQLLLSEFPYWLNWVLIVEEDLPDTLVLTPLLQRMAEHAPRSSIYIVRAEDDLSMLDSALDEIDLGEDDLLELEMPLLLFFNEEWQYLSQWGPRPKATEAFLDGWLEEHSEFERLALSEEEADQIAHARLLDTLTYEMRVWYVSQLDYACGKEVHAVLENIMLELDSDDVAEDGDEFLEDEVDDSPVDDAAEVVAAADLSDSDTVDSGVNMDEPSTALGADNSSDDEAAAADEAVAELESSTQREAEPTVSSRKSKTTDQRSDRRSNDRNRNNSRRRRKPPKSSQ